MSNHAALIRAEIGQPVTGRGRNHLEFDMGNDQRQLVAVAGRMHYGVDMDQEIDDAWQAGVAPWDFEMTQNTWQAHALARFDAGQIIKYVNGSGDELGFQPQQLQWTNDLGQIEPVADPQNVLATATDNKLEWIGAYGVDLDFEWHCRHSGLSKFLVIQNQAAIGTPPQFIIDGGNPRLKLGLLFQKSPNIDIYVNDQLWDEKANNPVSTSGIIDWRDSVTGEVRWRFHLPLASRPQVNENDETGAIVGEFWLRKTGPNLFVEIHIPWTWLETSTYPVKIDTDFSDQPDEASSKDSWINTSASSTNYGTDNNVYTDQDSRRVVLEFDASSIASGATCDAAVLSMWSVTSFSTRDFDIHSLTSTVESWVETEVTWDDYKTSTAWPGSSGIGTSGTDYEADASPPFISWPDNAVDAEGTGDLTTGSTLDAARIAGWFGGANTNYGIAIAITGSTSRRQWHSSAATTAGLRPKIAITYTAAGGVTIPVFIHHYQEQGQL